MGYGKTRRDILALVQTAASDRGVLRSSQVSEGWWRRFLERQSDLSLRQGDSTAHVQMNPETMDHYFSLLHDLLHKPAQICSVGESGVPFNPSAKGRGTKKVCYCSSEHKGQITLLLHAQMQLGKQSPNGNL